jgi:hypothetical protein
LQVRKHLQVWILHIDDFPVIPACAGKTDSSGISWMKIAAGSTAGGIQLSAVPQGYDPGDF